MHWYTPEGLPRHNATLREARKEGLFGSVTDILTMWPRQGLTNYFRTCDLLAGHTTPRLPEDTDEVWLARAIKSSDDEAAKARDTGTRRHAIIEQFNKGALKVGQHDPIDLAHCQPYFQWHEENVRKVRHAERIVVNKELGYAGTLDLDCMVAPKGTESTFADAHHNYSALVDVKNRKKLGTYDTDCMQLVAYDATTWNGHAPVKSDKLISIVLGTERQEILVREWTAEEIDHAWKNFKLCLELWQASKDYYPTKGNQ